MTDLTFRVQSLYLRSLDMPFPFEHTLSVSFILHPFVLPTMCVVILVLLFPQPSTSSVVSLGPLIPWDLYWRDWGIQWPKTIRETSTK